jgi:hypothetical protein
MVGKCHWFSIFLEKYNIGTLRDKKTNSNKNCGHLADQQNFIWISSRFCIHQSSPYRKKIKVMFFLKWAASLK